MISDKGNALSFGNRFETLLVSPHDLFRMIKKRKPGEISFEQSEQSYARRELLHVEKVAIASKRVKFANDAAYKAQVKSALHTIIAEEMAEQVTFTGDIFTKTLNLNDALTPLLDTLSVRAASISRIEPYVCDVSWLHDDLLQTVNTPTFRRKDARGKVIVVESLRTALRFLGIENLRLLIPSLILKRAMPQITDPYPLFKQKMTQYGIGTGVTSLHLSTFNSINSTQSYTLGVLSHLGRCAVVRLYFRLFNKIQRHLLEECVRDQEQRKHDALVAITPSMDDIVSLQHTYADALSADIIEHMLFKRLFIAEALREVASGNPVEDGSLASTLEQARMYTQIRMMHQVRATDVDEMKPIIKAQHFPLGALEKLKPVDVFTLPLSRTDDSE